MGNTFLLSWRKAMASAIVASLVSIWALGQRPDQCSQVPDSCNFGSTMIDRLSMDGLA